jgi:hypothetical protein
VVGLAAFAQAATAATGWGEFARFGGEGSEPGFAGTAGVAINQSTSRVYVVDAGNQRVERFGPNGTGLSEWPVTSPTQIAVDNSAGESAGDVYVIDSADGVIDKFDAEGNALGEIKETEALKGEPLPFSGLQGLAVDPAGSLWVYQASGEVDQFTGAKVNVFKAEAFKLLPELGTAAGFAIDAAEHLYLATGCGCVSQFGAKGEELGQVTPNFSPSVAADQSSNHVFVNENEKFSEYDAARNLVQSSGAGLSCATGLDILHSADHVYVADQCTNSVHVFEPVTLPVVTIEAPSGVTSTHADFSGTVDPEGTEPVNETTWHFEYSTDGGGSWTQTTGGTLSPGTSPVAVHDEVTLIPNEHVQVRLAATDAGGTSTTAVEAGDEFDTPAVKPDATTEVADDVTPDHAVLQGLVNPRNDVTETSFEYGTTTAYGTTVSATVDVNNGTEDDVKHALARLAGLTSGTTYHFRIVASNSAGSTDGDDETFTTTTVPPPSTGCPNEAIREAQRSQFLPECRAYEMVSPPEKNGGQIMIDSGRSDIAPDGGAARFASLQAFGDAIGTSVATDYVALRGSGGWATHAITPDQSPETAVPISRGFQADYAALSPDLSKGVFLSWSPVTEDPNVANVPDLYLRDDLRTPGVGAYQLLSPCPHCASTETPLPPLPGNDGQKSWPFFAGASADFGHVIFESQEPLTDDAPLGCTNLNNLSECPGNLYEWDHGTLRLAGILPDGTPAHGSQAGQGAGPSTEVQNLTPHTISSDGSRIFFTVPGEGDALYMRVDHTTTIDVSASERTPVDPNGAQPVAYRDASSDGSRVFFSTVAALTDDAAVNQSPKLYMYDASEPASDPHNLTLISKDGEPADTGDSAQVLGVSADGHYLYFAASNQLVAGGPFLEADRGLYVWHDGVLRFITSMKNFSEDAEDTNQTNWLFVRLTARVAPDGKHLLFSASHPFGPTGYNQGACGGFGGACREFYVYSYDSQKLACASCNPSGAPASVEAFAGQRVSNGGALTTPLQNQPLTADGREVFFSTAQALVPQDTNGKIDVYEYDTESGTAHLISSGTAPTDSYFMNASPSGRDVLFMSRSKLVGTDPDDSYDMYDARVEGGFAEPPPPPPACAGESCQGASSAQPDAPGSGSSLVTGDGNLAPPPPVTTKPTVTKCHKGFVHKRGKGKLRCVRKHKPHRHKARRTGSHRRAGR